jgi:hypothetical protein
MRGALPTRSRSGIAPLVVDVTERYGRKYATVLSFLFIPPPLFSTARPNL